MSTACSECGAVRGHLLGCSQDTHLLSVAPVATASVPTSATQWAGDAERFELRSRLFAPAVVLLVTAGLVLTGPGRFFLRTFFAMWLHEGGHALASWLCGVLAVPLPWVTMSADGRSRLFTLLLLAGLAVLGRRSYRQHRLGWVGVWSAVAVAVVVCSLVLPYPTARAFITFWGHGGALALGALGMSAFFVPPGSPLHRGALRWGFLVIGAAAYVDTLAVWLAAWHDEGEISFGQIEGVGLSDSSRLVDVHGWTVGQLVSRYLLLATLCAAGFGTLWVRGVLRQRERVRQVDAGRDPDDGSRLEGRG